MDSADQVLRSIASARLSGVAGLDRSHPAHRSGAVTWKKRGKPALRYALTAVQKVGVHTAGPVGFEGGEVLAFDGVGAAAGSMGLASPDGFDYVAELGARGLGVGAEVGEDKVALGVGLGDDCAPAGGSGGGAGGAVPAAAVPGADLALI
jgi:hypothetical protein